MLALNDQVSLLLKDSFIDSFPSNDRPFIKVLVLLFYTADSVFIFCKNTTYS
jgi:hypothetical protein